MKTRMQWMTGSVIVLMGLVLPSEVSAQKQQADFVTAPGWTSKVIKLTHADAERMGNLFLQVPGTFRGDPRLRALVVHAAPETVEFVEATVRELDVPQGTASEQNVEITFYILGATASSGAGMPVLAALRPVIRQFRDRFPYQGYRLLETAAIRVRSGEAAKVTGLIGGFVANLAKPAFYILRIHLENIRGEQDKAIIPMRQLSLEVRVPVVTSPSGTPPERLTVELHSIGIDTRLDIREGQMVVVGKAGSQGSVDGIFLVLKADVVD